MIQPPNKEDIENLERAMRPDGYVSMVDEMVESMLEIFGDDMTKSPWPDWIGMANEEAAK